MNLILLDDSPELYNTLFQSLFVNGFQIYYHCIDTYNLPEKTETSTLFLFHYHKNTEKISEILKDKKLKLVILAKDLNKKDADFFLNFHPVKIFLFTDFKALSANILGYLKLKVNVHSEKREFERYDVRNLSVEISLLNPMSQKIHSGKLLDVSLNGCKIRLYKLLEFSDKLLNKPLYLKIYFLSDIPFEVRGILIYTDKLTLGIRFPTIPEIQFPKLLQFLKNFIFYSP